MGQAASAESPVVRYFPVQHKLFSSCLIADLICFRNDQPQVKSDILSLNEEITAHIFSYLSAKELCIVSQGMFVKNTLTECNSLQTIQNIF